MYESVQYSMFAYLILTSSREPALINVSVMRQNASYCDGPGPPEGSE